MRNNHRSRKENMQVTEFLHLPRTKKQVTNGQEITIMEIQ